MKQLDGNDKKTFVNITFLGDPKDLKLAKKWCLENDTSISIEFRRLLKKLSDLAKQK